MRFWQVVVAAGLTAACSGGASITPTASVPTDSTSDAPADSPADAEPPLSEPGVTSTAGSAEFVVEAARWSRCADHPGLECATIAVPLDHAVPSGQTIPIALIRQPALTADRIGSVVFNPGGPGGSGLDFLGLAVASIPSEVADRFDLVSFDPRGVGASAAVECDLELDDGIPAIADDDRSAWDAALVASLGRRATCRSAPEELTEHLGTAAAARDLDLIRRAVGDELLTYVGFSYGTRLGAAYAELFPHRIRALVLDGAVPPDGDAGVLAGDQAAGFDRALVAFAEACDADTDCVLGSLGPTLDVLARVRAEIRERGELPVDEPGRRLTPGELDLAVMSALYGQGAWPYLARAIHSAATLDDGTLFQVLADRYLGRRPDGTYTNQVGAGISIDCADDPTRPPRDRVWEMVDEVSDRSRFFDELLRGSFGCIGLPAPLEPLQLEPLQLGPASGAPPILVIGTTGDPATPFEWSARLAGALDSAVLYTVEGEGHTAYTNIDCVESVVDRYLVDLVVPDIGASCTDDTDPGSIFLPAGEAEIDRVVAFFDCLADQGADVRRISIVDVLRDPSGTSLLDGIDFTDPGTVRAVGACQSILPI